jgi:predicted amidophosphoribosyltransferase
MALQRCGECGTDVSEYANSCPKCGCPFERSDSDPAPISFFQVIIVIIFWLIVIGAIGSALV